MNSFIIRHLHQTITTFQQASLHISKVIASTWPAAGAYDKSFALLGKDSVVRQYVTATIAPFSTFSS